MVKINYTIYTYYDILSAYLQILWPFIKLKILLHVEALEHKKWTQNLELSKAAVETEKYSLWKNLSFCTYRKCILLHIHETFLL